jgi:hypothetical protein
MQPRIAQVVFATPQTSLYHEIRMNGELVALARRLFWWKKPEEALADRTRFLAQVMAHGTWRDLVEARKHFGEPAFREVLHHAPPGVFDARSWTYWHHALHLLPVPPLPRRKFVDGL